MYGLEANEIQQINMVLANYPQIEKAILYGSRANGEFRPGSDIDLTLIGKALNLSLQLEIENVLDNLLLPYKIDLSLMHKIENKDLIDHIDRVGHVFYKKEEKI